MFSIFRINFMCALTYLAYGDVIYHNQRMDMMNLVDKVQYEASLVVSGCWLGIGQHKIYNELGWGSLSDRRLYRKLILQNT